MSAIEIPNDFTPRAYQASLMEYLDEGGKRAIAVWPRRHGKDLVMLHQVCKSAHTRKGVYWTVFPSFAQARKAIWEGFTRDGKRILENVFPGFLNPKGPRSIVKRKDEQQMSLELKCGSIWRLIGSDRIEVVGAGPVGVVFSEFAMANPKAWNMIRPMLRENNGWAVMISTPRGGNHFKDLYDLAVKDQAWFTEVLTLDDTGAWSGWVAKDGKPYQSAQQLRNEEMADGLPEPLVRQEYDCDWNAALVGSVWGDLLESAIKAGATDLFDHSYDNVFTSWDLGFTDSTAIWFWQVKDGGVDLIDCYADHGKPLSHYFDVVDRKPFRYVKHWLPHDARQTTLASGVSILNMCLKRWPGQVVIGPDLPLLDGINAGRWVIQQGIRVHPRCEEGFTALRAYHYDYDEEKKTLAARPVHDWSSHYADSFRYLAAVVQVSELLKKKPAGAMVTPKPAPFDRSFTLNQLFEDHDKRLAARRRI